MSLARQTTGRPWSRGVLHWALLFAAVTTFISPGVGDDSQVYHLPSMINILRSKSLVNFEPQQLYRPATFTNYYPRGFEALGAVLFATPVARPLLIGFKLCVILSFYFLLRRRSGENMISFALMVFLISMQMVRDDVGNLKNDLVMAMPLVWAAAAICDPVRGQKSLWIVPACCSVAMAIKSSALAYAAPILAIWFWKFRREWPKLLLAIFVIVIPVGLFFYLANGYYLGNPIHPFELKLAGWVLAPGIPARLFKTTIAANLDRDFIPLFARGLLRAGGPAGAAVLFIALAGALRLGIRETGALFGNRTSGALKPALSPQHSLPRPRSSVSPCAVGVFILWSAAFIFIPFSDNNAKVHSLLYSGGTIRLAFPVLFWGLYMTVRPLTEWTGRSKVRNGWILWGLAVSAVANFAWYDASSLFVKPENAFAWLAPVMRTFDNRLLAAGSVGIGAICAGAVFLNRRSMEIGCVAGAIVLQQIGFPGGLGYTMRFTNRLIIILTFV